MGESQDEDFSGESQDEDFSTTLSTLLYGDTDVDRSVTDILLRGECLHDSGQYGAFSLQLNFHPQSSSRSASNALTDEFSLFFNENNSASKTAKAESLAEAVLRSISQPSSRSNSRPEEANSRSNSCAENTAPTTQQMHQSLDSEGDAIQEDFQHLLDNIDWAEDFPVPFEDVDAQVIHNPDQASIQVTLIPNSEKARDALQSRFDAIHLEKRTIEQELHNSPYRAPQNSRTTSGRPFPEPTSFKETNITTGICHIFPSIPRDEYARIINVELLAQHFPKEKVLVQGTVSGVQQLIEANIDRVSSCKDLQESKRTKQPAARTGKQDKMCEISMHLLPDGGDKVVLKVWQGGRTQVCGCKSSDAVMRANIIVQHAILTGPREVLCVDDATWHRLAAAQPEEPQVNKLSIMGSWDVGLREAGVRLRQAELCAYLNAEHSLMFDKVAQLGAAAAAAGASRSKKRAAPADEQQKGEGPDGAGGADDTMMEDGCSNEASRFKLIKLYVKRSSVDACRRAAAAAAAAAVAAAAEEDASKPLYVNLYESGKCNVLGVASVEIGRELAWNVSQVLLKAFNVDSIREPITETEPKRHRRN